MTDPCVACAGTGRIPRVPLEDGAKVHVERPLKPHEDGVLREVLWTSGDDRMCRVDLSSGETIEIWERYLNPV